MGWSEVTIPRFTDHVICLFQNGRLGQYVFAAASARTNETKSCRRGRAKSADALRSLPGRVTANPNIWGDVNSLRAQQHVYARNRDQAAQAADVLSLGAIGGGAAEIVAAVKQGKSAWLTTLRAGGVGVVAGTIAYWQGKEAAKYSDYVDAIQDRIEYLEDC